MITLHNMQIYTGRYGTETIESMVIFGNYERNQLLDSFCLSDVSDTNIKAEIFSDDTMLKFYADGSMSICDYEQKTIKFYKSALKYWNRTRKMLPRIKDETHFLHQLNDYITDKPELIMRFHISRKNLKKKAH